MRALLRQPLVATNGDGVGTEDIVTKQVRVKIDERRGSFQKGVDDGSVSTEVCGNKWIEIKKDSPDHVDFSTEMATRFTLSRLGDITLV